MASDSSSAKSGSAAKPAAKTKAPSQQQIVESFQELRNQQRLIAGKLDDLEMTRKEHELVIETLTEIEPGRKCFRMVGSVLVERTVAEVLPALQKNVESMAKAIDAYGKQLELKGKELNDFRDQHNIRIRGEEKVADEDRKAEKSSTGILVSNKSS